MNYRQPVFLIRRALLESIACFVLLTNAAAASEWKTVDNTNDGIQVFEREVSGSSLVAFRGVGDINAPLLQVATILFDTERRRDWIAGLGESRILRWNDKDNFVEYDHIELPFFIRDRDFVSRIRVSFDQSRKEMVFRFQPSDDPSAPPTDYIRGEVINATFILSTVENDEKTRVDVEFLCDPKGLIPKWLVNYFLRDWPKTTFRNLRKVALNSAIPVDPRFSNMASEGTLQ